MSDAERPDIRLYTANTMNGWKPLIFLHEAHIEYELIPISFAKREQKSDWYLKLNPNGRIPTIVDTSNHDFVVFESGAILWYLAEKYDRFLSHDADERSETLQWLMFQMAGIGPMMGQAMYFQRIAKPNGHEDEYAIERYVKETSRLYGVLDRQLQRAKEKGGDYICGDYSIADMASYPWMRSYDKQGQSLDDFPYVKDWFLQMSERPAVVKAYKIAAGVNSGNAVTEAGKSILFGQHDR